MGSAMWQTGVACQLPPVCPLAAQKICSRYVALTARQLCPRLLSKVAVKVHPRAAGVWQAQHASLYGWHSECSISASDGSSDHRYLYWRNLPGAGGYFYFDPGNLAVRHY
jgi:hypothetical protein